MTVQEEVRNLAARHGADKLLIVLGINQPATIRILAQTFKSGDPGFAGPLAGVALNIDSYHILELQPHIPEEVWDVEMGMCELELGDEARQELISIMEEVRKS